MHIKITLKYIILTLLLLSGCSERALSLLDRKQAHNCLQRTSTAYSKPYSDEVYEKRCRNHKVDVIAYYINTDDNELTFSLYSKSGDSSSEYTDYEFYIIARSNASQFYSIDKVQIQGTLGKRAWWGGRAEIRNSSIKRVAMTNVEIEKREAYRNRKSSDQMIAEARAKALIQQAEDDYKLSEYAQNKRTDYINRAVRHSTHSSGGTTIDSFELPGDVFMVCRLTNPGPVYSCDETVRQD